MTQPRKGIYLLAEHQISDPLLLANTLRKPSYISLETAMNYYSLIPDIPSAVTSITTKKTKTYNNSYGKFIYRSIKPKLFFGFEYVQPTQNQPLGYNISLPEKALLDRYANVEKDLDNMLKSLEPFLFEDRTSINLKMFPHLVKQKLR